MVVMVAKVLISVLSFSRLPLPKNSYHRQRGIAASLTETQKSRDEVEAGTAAWLPDDKKGKRDIDIDKLMIAPKTTAKSVVTTKQQPFSFTPATTLTEHVMIRKQQTTSDSNRDVHFQRPRALASGILHGDRINKPQQTSHRQIHTFRMELENCECFEKK